MHVSLWSIADSTVRVGNVLYGDIKYVAGGVRVSVSKIEDGDGVPDYGLRFLSTAEWAKVRSVLLSLPFSPGVIVDIVYSLVHSLTYPL